MPIKLKPTSGAGSVFFDAPASVSSDVNLIVPATAGNLITTGDTNTVTATMMNTEGVASILDIKSKSAAVNPTNAATDGDYDNQAFTPNLEVDMGTPLNINTVYDLSAECQIHFDSIRVGSSSTDTGGYGGLGIQVSINGGAIPQLDTPADGLQATKMTTT